MEKGKHIPYVGWVICIGGAIAVGLLVYFVLDLATLGMDEQYTLLKCGVSFLAFVIVGWLLVRTEMDG